MGGSRPALSILAALSLLSTVAEGSMLKLPLAFAGGFSGLGAVRGWCQRSSPLIQTRQHARSLCARKVLGARMSWDLRGGAPLEGDDNAVSSVSKAAG